MDRPAIARSARCRFFSTRRVLVHANNRGIDDRELVVGLCSESVEDPLPDATLGPTQEPGVHRLPLRVMLRKITPRRTASQHPQDRVDHLPVRSRAATSAAFIRWQKISDPLPLLL